jgi:hypothetical protein
MISCSGLLGPKLQGARLGKGKSAVRWSALSSGGLHQIGSLENLTDAINRKVCVSEGPLSSAGRSQAASSQHPVRDKRTPRAPGRGRCVPPHVRRWLEKSSKRRMPV